MAGIAEPYTIKRDLNRENLHETSKRLCLLVSVFFIAPVLNAQTPEAIPQVVMQTLDECYENQNNTGIALAKCALHKL